MDAHVSASGVMAMAERDLCIAIGEDLARAYPGYVWMVGVQSGSIKIDLGGIEKPLGLANYGYRLNVSTVIGPGGQKAVMLAGGEMLERFGLRRTFAHPDTPDIARAHGLITDGARNKSRPS